MDSYVRLLRKTTADKLWLIIDKILVKLPIIIVIISIINYPYNMDKVWIPMSAYYGKLLLWLIIDKLLFIIDKIMVKLSIIIVIISNNYPYNMDKVWIPMSVYYGKLLPINYCSLSIKLW